MAFRRDITADETLFAGEDRTLQFTIYPDGSFLGSDGKVYTDETQSALAVAVNITGMTFRFAMRLRPGSTTEILRRDNEAGGSGGLTLTSPASGILSVNLAHALSSWLSLGGGEYWYSIARVDPGSFHEETYGTMAVLQGAAR